MPRDETEMIQGCKMAAWFGLPLALPLNESVCARCSVKLDAPWGIIHVLRWQHLQPRYDQSQAVHLKIPYQRNTHHILGKSQNDYWWYCFFFFLFFSFFTGNAFKSNFAPLKMCLKNISILSTIWAQNRFFWAVGSRGVCVCGGGVII